MMQLFWEAEADIFVCFKLNPTFFVEEFEQKKMKNRSGKSRASSRSGGERKDNDIARNAGSNSVRNDNVTCHTQQQIKTRSMTNTRNSS